MQLCATGDNRGLLRAIWKYVCRFSESRVSKSRFSESMHCSGKHEAGYWLKAVICPWKDGQSDQYRGQAGRRTCNEKSSRGMGMRGATATSSSLTVSANERDSAMALAHESGSAAWLPRTTTQRPAPPEQAEMSAALRAPSADDPNLGGGIAILARWPRARAAAQGPRGVGAVDGVRGRRGSRQRRADTSTPCTTLLMH
eukprot:299082-Pleurochrysis_carterae.AAC.1